MPAGAALVEGPMTQSVPAGKQRRAISIIPAIPRKLERKQKQEIVYIPFKAGIENVKGEQTGVTAGTHENDRTQGLRLQSAESQNDGEVFTIDHEAQDGIEKTVEDSKTTTSATQDFGIEKHGFRLPPPFYPASTLDVTAPSTLSCVDGSSGALQDSFQDLSQQVDETILEPCAESKNPSLPLHPISADFDLHSHPTPPINATPSPTQSSYQGYGQAQYTTLYPQSTPPTEASLSPTHFVYHECSHTDSTSYPRQPVSSFDPSSPRTSLYQGYMYDQNHTMTQSSPRQYKNINSPGNVTIPFRNDYGSSQHYYDQTRAFSIVGGHPPFTPSATPLVSASQEFPDVSSRCPSSINDGASTASTIPPNHISRNRNASQSILGMQESCCVSSTTKSGFTTVPPEKSPRREAGRATLLETLRGVSSRQPSSQAPLTDYLKDQFNNETYADCYLKVVQDSDRLEKIDFWLHSLLIAQSPKLKALLETTLLRGDGKRYLDLETHDRFITASSTESALRVCYGDLPLDFTGLELVIEPSKDASAISKSWMDCALAFTAAGNLLQLSSVIDRGLQIASAILDWDNVEKALCFTLEGRLDRSWDLNHNVQSSPSPSLELFVSSNAKITPDSTEGLSQPVRFDQQSDAPIPTDLSNQCLHFIVSRFPSSWELDISARPLAEIDRLPLAPKSRSPISKSRLSRIQFGDHPSENAAKSSDPSVILSSLLLSVPFDLLKSILDHVEPSIKRRTIRSVVEERERRRQRVLRSDTVSTSERQAAAEDWAEAGWEESVVATGEGEDLDLGLERKWTGF